VRYKRTYYRHWYLRRSARFAPSTAFSSVQIVGGATLILLFVYLTYQFGFSLQMAVMLIFLFLAILLGIITAVGIWLMYRRSMRWRALEVSQIDALLGIEFENYLAGLLKFKGFRQVMVTPPEGDYGADLTGYLDGKKYAVQAKQYNSWKKVGVEAIYQVLGGEKKYDCQATMVITTSYYTEQAKILAEKSKTELIDRDILLDWISEYVRK